jgi:hypothetical protein
MSMEELLAILGFDVRSGVAKWKDVSFAIPASPSGVMDAIEMAFIEKIQKAYQAGLKGVAEDQALFEGKIARARAAETYPRFSSDAASRNASADEIFKRAHANLSKKPNA